MDFIINANTLVDYVLILIGVYIVINSIVSFMRHKNASNTPEAIQEQDDSQRSGTKTLVFSIMLAAVLVIVASADLLFNKESMLGIMSNVVLVGVAILFLYYAKKRWA